MRSTSRIQPTNPPKPSSPSEPLSIDSKSINQPLASSGSPAQLTSPIACAIAASPADTGETALTRPPATPSKPGSTNTDATSLPVNPIGANPYCHPPSSLPGCAASPTDPPSLTTKPSCATTTSSPPPKAASAGGKPSPTASSLSPAPQSSCATKDAKPGNSSSTPCADPLSTSKTIQSPTNTGSAVPASQSSSSPTPN